MSVVFRVVVNEGLEQRDKIQESRVRFIVYVDKRFDKERIAFVNESVPLEPVDRVLVSFEPGNQPANGELLFSGVTGRKKPRPWFKLKEATVIEDDIKDQKLSGFQQMAYSRYIGALYGSMGLFVGSLPTEPIPLAATLGGVPVAARAPGAVGYDLVEFRRNLQLYSIEIQASIGG